MKKAQGNKKVVKTIRNAVAGAMREAIALKKKGSEIVKGAEKKWKESEPRRKGIEKEIEGTIKKISKKVDAKTKGIIKKTIQFKNDINKGVKQGMADVRRKK